MSLIRSTFFYFCSAPRFILFAIPFILILGSCDQRSKSHFDNIQKSDTTCLKGVEKAKAHIQLGRLTYCHFAGNLLYQPLRNAKEMESLLSNVGIEYREEVTSDVVMEGQTQGCYCDYMKETIDTKFSKMFIDSLLNVSDSLYVQHHINDTLYYANCDTRPNYPGDTITDSDEFSEVLQKDLEKNIIYPKDYIKRPNYDSSAFVNVYLYVDKAGNAYITGYRFLFDMKSNYKYEKYFQREIEKAMKYKDWTPATIRKQKVNADMVFRFYFD